MTKPNGRANGHTYPCASLDEALPELRRPPAPAAVRFKLTATNKENSAGQVAAYVDARLVFDRLDLVCGGAWHAGFDELPAALRPRAREGEAELLHVRCRLTVFGVTREDVGEGESPKAAFSDAIKRAAVHFGVGRALYAMASPWLQKGPGAGQLRTTRKGRLKIDERGEAHLRRGYERWLKDKGMRLFGVPLEHGDEAGAPGFEVVEGARREEGEDDASGAAAEPRPDAAANEADGSEGERDGSGPDQQPPEPAPPSPSQPDSAGQVRSAGLRPVASGEQSGPPATPQERQLLAHWRQAGGYRAETIERLARLACGEPLDRLTREQLKRVAWLLELAVGGRVRQATLQGSLTRLAKQQREPKEAVELLERWLRKKYDEVALLGRREAA